jgi:uncharacterized protein YlaN (UPF0358 family)
MNSTHISPRNKLASEIVAKYHQEIAKLIAVQLDAEMLEKIYCTEELLIILDDFTEHYGGE